MKQLLSYFIVLLGGIVLGVIFTFWGQRIDAEATKLAKLEEVAQDTVNIVWRQNHFLLTEENLMNEIKAQEIMFPEIVLAQAILETGHFKSNACTSKNNLFGLRKRDGAYMSFEHWTDCVAAYKKYIQRWKGEPPVNYYDYLDKIGYAEGKSYTDVLKTMVK